MLLGSGSIEAFGLTLVRTSAMVLGAPLFGLSSGFSGFKLGLIVALAGTMYSLGVEPLPGPIGPIEFGVLALRELVLGFFLAFCLQVTLVAVQVAGELVGHDMGFTMSSQMDPESGVNSGMVPRIYETFLLLGLLAMDAHHWLVQALFDSFQRAPVGRMSIGSGLAPAAIAGFTQMFAAGLTFAAPVVVCLVLSTAILGLLARLVPSLNVFDMSFQLRLLLGMGAMTLFAPLLSPAINALAGAFSRMLGQALGAIGG